MIRSLGLSLSLLSIVLLSSACALSARSERNVFLNPGPTVQIKAVAQAFNPSQVLAIWVSPAYADNNIRYGKGDNTGGGDHQGYDRNPEPSTMLSFGAALLIGGGVIYSRRMRKIRK
jgi:hypothetical protein